MKKTLLLAGIMLMTRFLTANADVDPNFYVYLCFGQSNMEGNAQWELQDQGNVDQRFKMLATCNFDNPKRTMGNWYTAECPIISPTGKLGPTDYFGRTMVKVLPKDVKVGVVGVAMGGSPIEMFDKDKYQQKMQEKDDKGNTPWHVTLANMYYGGNPYGRLIEMAKKAQEVGVIKGILLHQGCSNCGNPEWPNMVKKIYNDILADLGLGAKDVPLFAGEVEYENMGGGCSGHNVQVNRLPDVIPTAHVVSAKDIPGNGIDSWHFSAAGYRTLGKRYAYEVLRVMGVDLPDDAEYEPNISGKITMGATTREYLGYVPKNLGLKRPLLISCHGMNQDAPYQKGMLQIESVADTAKFVTVFPQGINNSWDLNGRKDINFILKIIEKMVEQYDIDPGKVYLSGFSMGGMFTYHAMNMIPDRIAAFAPISGYTLNHTGNGIVNAVTVNANARAIPIIHTHGTSDSVVPFATAQAGLDLWISHNHCNATATVTKNYRGASHITRHAWSGGDNGVEVVLMELAGKDHFVSNDVVMTGEEIWKFCKRYSIEVEWPYNYVTPGLKPDKKFTSLQEIGTTPFAIVNEAEGKAFFGSNNQNLDYQDYETAFSEGNSGYLWKLENCNEVANGYLLRLITPQGTEYSIWGNRGYLNGFSTVADCSFVLGLNNQNGQDVANGAVWEIEYVDDKGFTLKNKYTNKYLHDARSAQQVEPKYFTFCTLSETATGISTVRYTPVIDDDIIYDLNGRRVNESTLRPGIYIKNRKKIVIR